MKEHREWGVEQTLGEHQVHLPPPPFRVRLHAWHQGWGMWPRAGHLAQSNPLTRTQVVLIKVESGLCVKWQEELLSLYIICYFLIYERLLQYQGRKVRKYIAPHKNVVRDKAQTATLLCWNIVILWLISTPCTSLVLQTLSLHWTWTWKGVQSEPCSHHAGRDSEDGIQPRKRKEWSCDITWAPESSQTWNQQIPWISVTSSFTIPFPAWPRVSPPL